METTFHKVKLSELLGGFNYKQSYDQNLWAWHGQLLVQPEYQRNYVYEGTKDKDVVGTVLKGLPIGVMYFHRNADGKLEVLDGQQRLTSLGRFKTDKLFYEDDVFSGIAEDIQESFLEYEVHYWEVSGSESEIKDWFEVINKAGIELNKQELLNATYSGPFISMARAKFSSETNTAEMAKWRHYLTGEPNQQAFLATALDWISNGNVQSYMSDHRTDTNIDALLNHFNAVLNWVRATFPSYHNAMKGLPWGRLYVEHGHKPQNSTDLDRRVAELMIDEEVSKKKGIFEYLLTGASKHLNLRTFDKKERRILYDRQTSAAVTDGVSNCPHCALIKEGDAATKIFTIEEMEADHITPWCDGGKTTLENGQMLCKHHNRIKGGNH